MYGYLIEQGSNDYHPFKLITFMFNVNAPVAQLVLAFAYKQDVTSKSLSPLFQKQENKKNPHKDTLGQYK
jgi:hypothetical protein